MKITVDSEQTKQVLLTLCQLAGTSQRLDVMKAAVVVSESITVASPSEAAPDDE